MAQVAPRLLIVEDSPPISYALEVIFRKAGFEVTIASDGNAAADLMQHGEFEIVLLDYNIPFLTGEELCLRFLAHPRRDKTTLIMLSSKVIENVQEFQRRCGVAAVFPKPFSSKKLLAKIRELLPSSEAHQVAAFS